MHGCDGYRQEAVGEEPYPLLLAAISEIKARPPQLHLHQPGTLLVGCYTCETVSERKWIPTACHITVRRSWRSFARRGELDVGRNASKVDLQIALWAYEEVKRLHATTEEENPELQDAQDRARRSVSTRGLSQMELDIDIIDTYSLAQFRKLCSEKGLKIIKGYPKLEHHIALEAWERVRRMQTAPREESEEDYFTTLENLEPWLYLTSKSGQV
ncbi:hypothetical protein NDU88_004339 [Pleurodeles waltl]|uniref:Uncharacterized protein n=1 Tax=Pleurodeles waltl TaxID=8319 RepID=A0AAV7WS15_PLEWA|nr:hypothetical protein NDU88_004339 [Pleurodeles waltl]